MDNKELSAEEKAIEVFQSLRHLFIDELDSGDRQEIISELSQAMKDFHKEELIKLRDDIQCRADIYCKGEAVEFIAYKMGLETGIEIIDNRIKE
jgi:predicted methyltransferase